MEVGKRARFSVLRYHKEKYLKEVLLPLIGVPSQEY